jgi:hypothetical protein
MVNGSTTGFDWSAQMTDTGYRDRQNLEFFCWPELREQFQGLVELVMVAPGNLSRQLRRHYYDRQIVEMLAVISLAGWFNRWNNSIATVTDRESVEWAQVNLAKVGWELGKHAGAAHEQRAKHPRSSDPDRIE